MQQSTINELANMLIKAKALEAQANKERIAIEQRLIEALGKKEEGSQTHELECGLKVTITGKMTYSADMPLLVQLCAALPEQLRPIKTKTELDSTGAKFLRNNEPEAWAILAPAITMKPAKPSVEIKA